MKIKSIIGYFLSLIHSQLMKQLSGMAKEKKNIVDIIHMCPLEPSNQLMFHFSIVKRGSHCQLAFYVNCEQFFFCTAAAASNISI